MIRKILLLNVLVLIIIFASACATKLPPKPPGLDANQLRSLQIKEIEGDLETCFNASVYILQDEGWMIKTADKSNGLIQAESLKTKSSFSPEDDYLRSVFNEMPSQRYEIFRGTLYTLFPRWERWNEANVSLEKWGKNTTQVRFSAVKKGFLASLVYSTGGILTKSTNSVPERNSSEVLDDPTVYQNFFARLKKEVFTRQNLER